MSRYYGSGTGPYGGRHLGGSFGGGSESRAFVAVNHAVVASAASLDVPLPGAGPTGLTIQTGDLIMAIMACTTTGSTHTTPAGYTLLHTEYNTVTEVEMYAKIATGADTPGTNVNFLSSGAVAQKAAVAVFRGNGIAVPNPVGVTTSPTVSTVDHPIDASTVVPANRGIAVILGGWETAVVTNTPPAGWEEALDSFTSPLGIVVFYKFVPPGAIGSVTFDSSSGSILPYSLSVAQVS